MKDLGFKQELFSSGLYNTLRGIKTPLRVTEKPTALHKEEIQEIFKIQAEINLMFQRALYDTSNFDNLPDAPIYNILLDMKRRKQYNCDITFIYLRSDYIIDRYMTPKLVEYNAVAASFFFYEPKLNKIHAKTNRNVSISQSDVDFIDAINLIFKFYSDDCVALMVDQDTTIDVVNYSEKKMIIHALSNINIDMIHVTMNDIKTKSSFRGREMYYMNKKVFFIYYRWFYNYSHYSEDDIEYRIRMESTDAVSNPTVELQLLGLKHFQTILPDKISQYISRHESISRTFVKYKKIKDFKKGEENMWVLKTFNEGGKSNFFKKDIPLQIEKGFKDGFLMENIKGFVFKNLVNDVETDVVVEVGVFGVLISRKNKILKNKTAGHIVRSKDSKSNECGVTCGSGYLDSILK
ncbi:Glutathione synthetase [Cucumispora dikerogammari]|nr:Glutathione synthetase [Cucumispora dikerogammari]